MNLADAVLRLVPIEARLASPIAFAPEADDVPLRAELVGALFSAAGMRAPQRLAAGAIAGALEQMAARLIGAAGLSQDGFASPASELAAARARGLDGVAARHVVTSHDGARLSAVRAGQAQRTHPVLLLGAPGMPLELTAGWMRGLSAARPVASWETRGLFGPGSESVQALSIDDQLADAVAVLDDAMWPDAHVVGLCGGAPLALALAARHPRRVRSLVLWFGDLDFGADAPKTAHQRNLQALMEMVVSRRVSAHALREVLVATMAGLADPELAPLALYPFANATLLDQYCRMNHPIMSTDCSADARRVVAPCLVGYSPDDTTTHPAGSRHLAALLGAELEEVPASGHLDSLRGRAADVARVLAFQRGHDPQEDRDGDARAC